jgi:hypothetical protein
MEQTHRCTAEPHLSSASASLTTQSLRTHPTAPVAAYGQPFGDLELAGIWHLLVADFRSTTT